MKNVIKITLIALIISSLSPVFGQECSARARHDQMRSDLGKACDHADDRFNCLDILEVTDGDTISVNIVGAHPYFAEDTSVRLFGLDTPESRPPTVKCIPTVAGDADVDREEYEVCLEAARLRECEKEASKESAAILEQAICEESDRVDVELVRDDRGDLIREKFGRILGNVFIVNYKNNKPKVTDVGELLLSKQLAFPYDGGTKVTRDWCNKKIVEDTKLQSSYVKDNFCSSRRCTEKTYQVRCGRRGSYARQMNCYEAHVSDKIKQWFNSCQNKSGSDRRECYVDKSADYLSFCSEYDSTSDVKKCRGDLSSVINNYCTSELTGRAAKDCSLAVE